MYTIYIMLLERKPYILIRHCFIRYMCVTFDRIVFIDNARECRLHVNNVSIEGTFLVYVVQLKYAWMKISMSKHCAAARGTEFTNFLLLAWTTLELLQ